MLEFNPGNSLLGAFAAAVPSAPEGGAAPYLVKITLAVAPPVVLAILAFTTP
jgi:hypothetical protein